MPHRSRGGALLLALLVVAVVATFSAQAYWAQHQAWATEEAEEHRLQAHWLLGGALDWARQRLHEDVRQGPTDHLGETWALPLTNAPVSGFLAPDNQTGDAVGAEPRLSAQVTDAQGRMNLRNLLRGDEDRPSRSDEDVAAFRQLFAALQLPGEALDRLVEQLLRAHGDGPAEGRDRPLPPRRFEQLAGLGLPPDVLDALAPHATWLPERTPLNLNTAGPEALMASVPGLDLAQARQFVGQRARGPAQQLADARRWLGGAELDPDRFATGSQYFLVQSRLRWHGRTLHEVALLQRSGPGVRTLWRDRDDLSQPRRRFVTTP